MPFARLWFFLQYLHYFQKQKQKALKQKAKALTFSSDITQAEVDNISRRIYDLEKQMDPQSYADEGNLHKPEIFRKCTACDHQILRSMENNPIIRQLQDKIESLHYKLIECRNQNQILRRDLLVAKKRAEKEMDSLVTECANLRGRLENSKSRNRELIEEVHMLRGEVATLVEKNKEDTGIINALHNVESQLKDTLDDRSELRRSLDGSQIRNKRLAEEISSLKHQVQVLMDKTQDDNMFIDALSTQNKRMQEMLDREQMLNHQAKENFKDELRRMKVNHSTNTAILEQLQTLLSSKQSIIKQMEEELASDVSLLLEESQKKERKPSQAQAGKSDEDQEENDETAPDAEEQENADEEGEVGEEEESEEKTKMVALQLECAQHKAMYETTLIEIKHLTATIASQNNKIDCLTRQLINCNNECNIKDEERKKLLEKVKQLEKICKIKKKGKPWDKKKASGFSKIGESEELTIKLDIMSQENDFLRAFLASTIETKNEDFQFYKNILAEMKNQFLSSLKEITDELASKKKAKEEEEAAEEEEDEEANETPDSK